MIEAIRRRLTRIYLVMLAALLVGFSLTAFFVARTVLWWGLDEANHHLAMPVVAALQAGPLTSEGAARALSGLTLTSDERVEVWDAAGGRIESRPPARDGAPEGAAPKPGVGVMAGPDAYRTLTVPVTRGDRVIGYVRAAHALAQPNYLMGLLAAALAVMVPIALLVAWMAGDWLVGQAVRPVEAAMRRERQFLRDAAHELRTPLAVLQMQTDLAVSTPGLTPDVRDRLDPLGRTVRRMSALVTDLLALSREDAGVAGTPQRFALDELVEDELALLRPLAESRAVTLDWRSPGAESTVEGDPERLDRAVRNLLDNAIRYSPAGGAVTVRLLAQGPCWALQVGNDGPAIAEGDQARLFERFYRAPGGQQAHPEGTGLGLAIARAIARAHHGELSFESTPAGQTTVTLTVPKA